MEEPTSNMPSANISTALITVSLDVDKETSTWGWGGENDIDFRSKDFFNHFMPSLLHKHAALPPKLPLRQICSFESFFQSQTSLAMDNVHLSSSNSLSLFTFVDDRL